VSITTPHHLIDHFSVVEQNICILKLLLNSPLNFNKSGELHVRRLLAKKLWVIKVWKLHWSNLCATCPVISGLVTYCFVKLLGDWDYLLPLSFMEFPDCVMQSLSVNTTYINIYIMQPHHYHMCYIKWFCNPLPYIAKLGAVFMKMFHETNYSYWVLDK